MARGKGRKSGSGSSSAKSSKKIKGASIDVAALREALGRPHGNKPASRSMLAELIGASEGSVLNWEKGKPPTAKYAQRLHELSERAAKGAVELPFRNRGGRRPRNAAPATAAAAPAARRGPGRPPATAPVAGSAGLVYANQLTIERGSLDARLRFAVRVPGESAARSVADVMVPRHVLDQLGL